LNVHVVSDDLTTYVLNVHVVFDEDDDLLL
jgi:hypothetical protein